jgi:hypothetical protein
MTISVSVEIPDAFLCPITQEIMRDPLMCRSGLSFERAAIIHWLYHHNNACPITRRSLAPRDLVKNSSLRLKIDAWCLENGVKFEEDKDEEAEPIICTCLISILNQKEAASKKRSATNSTKSPFRGARLMLLRKSRPHQ